MSAPLQPVAGCDCGCCADARERIRCGGASALLPLREACWCHLYEPDEHCWCDFCRAVIGGATEAN